MMNRYIPDSEIQALVNISPFWRVFASLREDWTLPPAVAAFVKELRATQFPAQKLALVKGALLADELVGMRWPEAAKRQAVLLIDKAIREHAERVSKPFPLTIPQPDNKD